MNRLVSQELGAEGVELGTEGVEPGTKAEAPGEAGLHDREPV